MESSHRPCNSTQNASTTGCRKLRETKTAGAQNSVISFRGLHTSVLTDPKTYATHDFLHKQLYFQVKPGKPGAEVSKGKKTISQRKNLPI